MFIISYSNRKLNELLIRQRKSRSALLVYFQKEGTILTRLKQYKCFNDNSVGHCDNTPM